MSTKTMRLPPRRALTPNASNKRKDREDFDALKSSTTKFPKTAASQAESDQVEEPASSNQLLAGYLANEFLTRGTLFGQLWDPNRAQVLPVPAVVESRTVEPGQKAEAEPSNGATPQEEKDQRYVAVASLLKTDGAHLPGIVNPTQLARLLQL